MARLVLYFVLLLSLLSLSLSRPIPKSGSDDPSGHQPRPESNTITHVKVTSLLEPQFNVKLKFESGYELTKRINRYIIRPVERFYNVRSFDHRRHHQILHHHWFDGLRHHLWHRFRHLFMTSHDHDDPCACLGEVGWGQDGEASYGQAYETFGRERYGEGNVKTGRRRELEGEGSKPDMAAILKKLSGGDKKAGVVSGEREP